MSSRSNEAGKNLENFPVDFVSRASPREAKNAARRAKDARMKAFTDHKLELDIRRMKRSGALLTNYPFKWVWSIDNKVIGSVKVQVHRDHLVLTEHFEAYGVGVDPCVRRLQITYTACKFGGVRPWFICPSTGCGKRSAILYGGPRFVCRDCHNLAYRSQNEGEIDRLMSRAEKIRRRLGWRPGFANPHGTKPKGMHWITYAEYCRQHDEFAAAAWSGASRVLGFFKRGDG